MNVDGLISTDAWIAGESSPPVAATAIFAQAPKRGAGPSSRSGLVQKVATCIAG